MSIKKITTIINYCTNDYMFIRPCINAIKGISSQVIVPVCNTMYDGKAESRLLLKKTYDANPSVSFLEFPYAPNRAYLGSRFWTNMARYVGLKHMAQDADFILFLDADEIVDTDRLVEFIREGALNDWDAIRPVNYWYFRDVMYQAKSFEASALIVRADKINSKSLFSEKERIGIFEQVDGRKLDWGLGLDKKPLIHHYSWVRSREQMLRKVKSWGHNNDKHRNWEELVKNEFSHEFNGTDFIHGYEYNTVLPFCQLDSSNPHFVDVNKNGSMTNVEIVDKGTVEDGIKIYLNGLPFKKKMKLKLKGVFSG